MIGDRYFFEIPIYRISHDAFVAQYDRDLAKNWEDFARRSGYTRAEVSDDLRRTVEQHFWEHYGAPWHYNQAVGWIRMFVCGSQIRGELFMSNAKRFARRAIRNFRWQGKAFELHCWPEQSSDDIRAGVEQALHEAKRELRHGQLFMDLECFTNIARQLDWRGMIGFDNAGSQETAERTG